MALSRRKNHLVEKKREDTPPLPVGDRSKNRRRMAWISLVAMLIVTGYAMGIVPIERLEKLEVVITWFYMSCASVIGAYMGFTTWAAVAGRSNSSSSSYYDDSSSSSHRSTSRSRSILSRSRDEES